MTFRARLPIWGALALALALVLLASIAARSRPFFVAVHGILAEFGWVSESVDEVLAQTCERDAGKLGRREPARAVALFEEAIRIWTRLGDPDRTALAREKLGSLQIDLRDFESAMELLAENQRYYEASGQPEQAVDTLLWMASCRTRQEADHLALELYDRAELRAQDLGYLLGQASAASGRGVLHQRAGEFEEALNQYRIVTDLYGKANRPMAVAATWDNRAACLMILGRMEEANAALQAALEIHRQVGNSPGMATTLVQQGWYFALDREPEKAISAYREALVLQEAAGNLAAQSGILDRMGSAWVELKRFGEARSHYLKASSLAEGRTADRARIWSNLCRLGVLEKSFQHPEDFCARSLELFAEVQDPGGEAAAAHWGARQRLTEGKLEAALALAERSVGILERLRLEVASPARRSQYFNDRVSYYQTLTRILVGLHSRHPEEAFDALAFEASEKMRARSLLDLLRNDLPARDRVTLKSFVREEAELRQQLQEKANAAAGRHREGSSLERRHEAAESWLRDQLDRPTGFAVAQELHSLVDADTLVLAYSLGEESSHLWTLDPTGISLYELSAKREIEELAAAYFSLISSTDSLWAQAQAQVVGSQLAAALLAPVAGKLEGRRLVIVPDGMIAYIPFGSLPDPERPGEPLLSRFEIAFLPSLTLLKALRDRPGPASSSFDTLVVADPIYGGDDPRLGARRSSAAPAGWNRLAGTGEEAEMLRIRAPGPVQVWSGLDARRDAILHLDLKRFSLIHFATHGRIDGQNPEESALLLSVVDREARPIESRLRVRDLFGLDLDAELVVASACRTGLGGEARGEGMTSFASAFLLAGSDRVLVSLWPIEDGTTALLMGHFYDALFARGMAPAAALRFAQLEIRKNPRTTAPYYWSAFVLQGDWSPLDLP